MRPHCWDYDTNGLDHYFTVKQLAVPMTLYLYNYDFSSQTVESNLVAWEPTTPQWWITGFNPKHVGKVDVHKQVMIGSVVFNTKAMYDYFVEYNGDRTTVKDYIICDENNMTVWLMWYDKETV